MDPLRLGFPVERMLITEFTVLFHLKLASLIFLVLCNGIISPFTILTGQQYNVSHRFDL